MDGVRRAVDLITIEEQYVAGLDCFGPVDYSVAVKDAAVLEQKQLVDEDRRKGKQFISANDLDHMEEPDDKRQKATLDRWDQLISAMVQSARVRLKEAVGDALSSGKG